MHDRACNLVHPSVIVGFGHVAEHAYLQVIERHPHLDLVAVVDTNARRRGFARQSNRALVAVGSIHELPKPTQATLAFNLTPIPRHAQTSAELIAAGYHVYSEKPAAASSAEWHALCREASAAGVGVVSAPFPHIGWTGLALAGLIADRSVGEIVGATADASRRGPFAETDEVADRGWFFDDAVGPARDLGIYAITYLIALLGRPRSTVWVNEGTGPAMSAAALMTWPGCVGTVQAAFGRAAVAGSTLTLYGTAGRIETDLWRLDADIHVHRYTEVEGVTTSRRLTSTVADLPKYRASVDAALALLSDRSALVAHHEEVSDGLDALPLIPGPIS